MVLATRIPTIDQIMKRHAIILLMSLLGAMNGLYARTPLEILEAEAGKEYTQYGKEYMRVYASYLADGRFDDYLQNGNKYTVFVPDNFAIEEYHDANGGPTGNMARLCNTIKFGIAKGYFPMDRLKDGQKLFTLFPSNPLTVKIKKGKVYIVDKQGNSEKLGKCIEAGNILFYPVKKMLRY